MTTRLGKSCSFGLLFVSFVGVCRPMCPSFAYGFEGGMWNLNVLIPDHFLSIYFTFKRPDVLRNHAACKIKFV